MPVLDLKEYFELSNETGLQIEISQDQTSLRFENEQEQIRFEVITEFMRDFDRKLDKELFEKVDQYIVDNKVKVQGEKDEVKIQFLAFQSQELRDIPPEMLQYRVDALLNLNKSYLEGINMVYDDHSISNRLADINPNAFSALMAKSASLGLISIKNTYVDSELKRLGTRNSSEPKITFDRVRIQERRDQNNVDHSGIWTMFGTAMNSCKRNNYSALKINKSSEKCWSAEFKGENSVDAGGPYRDSLSNIIEELYTNSLPLLIPTPNNKNDHGEGRDLWTLNPASSTQDHWEMYKFLGALMAMAFRSGQVINVKFPSIIWKRLLGRKPTLDDLFRWDAYAAQHLQEIMKAKESVRFPYSFI